MVEKESRSQMIQQDVTSIIVKKSREMRHEGTIYQLINA